MSENKDILLKELIDKNAKIYMKLACNNGVPDKQAEKIVEEVFWLFYNSKYFGRLNEEETKVMIAKITKNKCRDFIKQKNTCKETDRMNTGMGYC